MSKKDIKNKNNKKSVKTSSNKKNRNVKDTKVNKKKKDKEKIVKLKTDFNSQNLIHTKKLKISIFVIVIIFLVLLIRIGFLQFVDGNSLKELAYKQQTINQIISPKRGNIYDSSGKALAISASVDTITINPTKIKDDNNDEEKTKLLKEKVAQGLSDIFALDYNEVLEKVQSNSQIQTIIKKVEKEKVDSLKAWMKENSIKTGINIDEDTKRYYPYNTVLSHVLGFCGTDNQGLGGIEKKWDSVLTGTPGKIVSSKASGGQEIPNAEEKYIAAENGSDLTLTIDLNIQTIVEKYLKQAVEENSCNRGGNVIVMNPKNGDILAMTSYPDYNLNDPYTPNSTLAKTYSSLSSEEKTNSLYAMYRNKSISELYEPGSVFKVITSAVALEENITRTDVASDFYCRGYEEFANGNLDPIKIKCWRAEPHGVQTLRTALQNSCNPAFMQLGKRIGAPTLYTYYKAFGLFDTTGVGLPGESNSIFTKQENVGPVELATMSFGQRFNITPLQMITAISCVANDGILIQPRIVKEITNTDTGAVTQVAKTEVRQVISKTTAEQVKSMMESVVVSGTGRNGGVSGYSIGGKTGTSEPTEKNKEEGYVASYVAISPIENTQVALLLTLYDPTGKSGHQGGQVAGPVVSQMLAEILPYLGIPSDANQNEATNSTNLIVVPDIRNKTITEAEKILTNSGFKTKVSVTGDKNSLLVTDQVPKPGISLSKDSIIVIYSTENTISTSVTVPDLKGMGASEATTALRNLNLNISIDETGVVVSQDPAKGSDAEPGTVVKVTLKKSLTDAH